MNILKKRSDLVERITSFLLIIMFFIPGVVLSQTRDKSGTINSPENKFSGETLFSASPSAPKFALLIGINDYDNSGITPNDLGYVKSLRGCENDVDSVKELLTTYYNFPDDGKHIVVLKSQEATRDRILKEFDRHLIANAETLKGQKPTIVFYYSGHGSHLPDTNEDEGDGQDETLVPYDRRKAGDIVDDTLDEKFDRLRQFTDNITFILDSCYSGTAIRDVPELNARETPSLAKEEAFKEPKEIFSSKDSGNGILPRKVDSFVTISGCLPYQKSYERQFPNEKTGQMQWHGVMTYYIIKTLEGSQEITYRELGEVVQKQVQSKYSYQEPQVEGNIDRQIFQGFDPNSRRYVRIIDSDEKTNTVTIQAGKAQGLSAGGFIAIYQKKVESADNKPISVGEIIGEPKDFTSTALLSKAAKPVSKDDRVLILTPGFGSERLAVVIDTNAKAAGAGEKVAGKIVELLSKDPSAGAELKDKSNPLVKVVAAAARPLDNKIPAEWDAAVVRETYARYKKDLIQTSTGKNTTEIADSDEVYYVTSRDGIPLLRAFVRASDPQAAEKIVELLETQARKRNVETITNGNSILKKSGKIKVRLLEVQIDAQQNEIKETPLEDAVKGVSVLKAGTRFRIQAENSSERSVYLTLIAINPNGNIEIVSKPGEFTPVEIQGEVKSGRTVKSYRQRNSLPTGKTLYKLFVTTNPVDFSFLENEVRRGDPKDAGNGNPFASLLARAHFGNSVRDSGKDTPQSFDDWATFDLNVETVIDK